MNLVIEELKTKWVEPEEKYVKALITPEIARKLLQLNAENNRNLAAAVVKAYARDMRRKQWKDYVPSDVIVISKSGKLLNGQHRLHAVIEAGVSIGFIIVYDVPDEMFDYLDNGKKRSAADFVVGKFYNERATLARSVLMVEHGYTFAMFGSGGGVSSKNVSYAPSRKEVADKANADTVIYESCERGKSLYQSLKTITSSVASKFCWVVYVCEGNFDSLDRFLEELKNDYSDNISARTCQRCLVGIKIKEKEGYKASNSYLLAVLLKGYQNFINKSSAKNITKPEKARDEYEATVKQSKLYV